MASPNRTRLRNEYAVLKCNNTVSKRLLSEKYDYEPITTATYQKTEPGGGTRRKLTKKNRNVRRFAVRIKVNPSAVRCTDSVIRGCDGRRNSDDDCDPVYEYLAKTSSCFGFSIVAYTGQTKIARVLRTGIIHGAGGGLP